jgi:methylated-DNA-[protein]-cysteine S-methyltransferase
MGSTSFDTAIGRCAISWEGELVTGTALLPRSAASTGALPGFVERAIAAITELMSGTPVSLDWIGLDWSRVSEFERRVYEETRLIPPGEVRSYGEIATRLGTGEGARAVGAAVGRNPFPVVVPCHRVVAAGGAIGGFSAPGGVSTKLRMLAIEGAPVTLPML